MEQIRFSLIPVPDIIDMINNIGLYTNMIEILFMFDILYKENDIDACCNKLMEFVWDNPTKMKTVFIWFEDIGE